MFVSSVKKDEEEQHKNAKKLIEKIYETPNPFELFKFFTSKFSLIELGEVITRKVNVSKAKSVQFDLLNHPEKRIRLSDPYKPDKRENGKSYFDIDQLVLELSYTGMKYQLPVFDTIHCHTILTTRTDIVISSDKHFKKFEKLGIDLETPKTFLKKYFEQKTKKSYPQKKYKAKMLAEIMKDEQKEFLKRMAEARDGQLTPDDY